VITSFYVLDEDGDTITYTILSGDIDAIFGFSGNAFIIVDDTNLDYETTTGYTLVIEADDGLFSVTGTLSVEVLDVT